jgi:hypothetical protein
MLFQIRTGCIAIACIMATSWLHADDAPPPTAQIPLATPPLASVVALAAAQHIPMQGIDPARDTQVLRSGDALTVLFTLFESGHRQQWLAEIKVVLLTDEERHAKPRGNVLYSGTGNEYRLASAPAAFALRMFGPFRDTDASVRPAESAPEKRARFLVHEDFLSFGYDRYCEMVLRLRAIGQEPRFGVMTGPFSEKDIAWNKRWAKQAGFTPEDESVSVKQAFALVEFFKIAEHTPGLKDIAEATVEIPSIWSVLRTRKLGVYFDYDWKNVQRLDGKIFGLESSNVYVLPFGLTMFGKHVANGSWLATAARPPLLASAGVVGLTVGPPDNKEKYLELHVIAARNASP